MYIVYMPYLQIARHLQSYLTIKIKSSLETHRRDLWDVLPIRGLSNVAM
jgi:hypothetical protein